MTLPRSHLQLDERLCSSLLIARNVRETYNVTMSPEGGSASPRGWRSRPNAALLLLLALTIAVVGCQHQRTPASPSSTSNDRPPTNLQISGVVTETISGQPVNDAFVIATPYCGTATTDLLGHYVFGGCTLTGADGQRASNGAPLTVKVSSTGFESQTRQSELTSGTVENFVLSPIATPTTNIAGAWTITIGASASCAALPELARVRHYDATLTQLYARVTVTLASPTITVFSGPVGGTGTIIDGTVSFPIAGDTGYVEPGGLGWSYPDFSDQVSSTEWLAIVGGVHGTVAGSEIRGVMDGEIEYWNGDSGPTLKGPPSVVCSAKDHNIVLRRR
jgi:hypothetical protein